MAAELRGYRRDGRRPGARDFVLVLPSVVCAGLAAEGLAGDRAVAIVHQHGCLQVGDDLSHSRDVFAGLALNPNVAATVVVSLGCETLQGRELAAEIAERGGAAELVGIQASGGTAAAIEVGREALARLLAVGDGSRSAVAPEELALGLDAGEEPVAAAVAAAAVARGIEVVRAAGGRGPVVHPELAAAGAQVIVSVVAADQAPVGFPVCPVVAVGVGGELHDALAPDFDLLLDGPADAAKAEAIVELAERAFDGAPTRAEQRGSREFALRRLAVTM